MEEKLPLLMYLDPKSIIIPPDRQRKDFGDERELQASIHRRGLLHPIVIAPPRRLVAGERRLRAWLAIKGNEPIPCRPLADLSEDELYAIELEENIKRKDLTWQEVAHACAGYTAKYPTKSLAACAADLGMSDDQFVRYVNVGRALKKAHPRVLECTTLAAADNILKRELARVMDNEFAEIDQIGDDTPEVQEADKSIQQRFAEAVAQPTKPGEARAISSSAPSILQADFHEFAKTYSGPKFNFIHCDFPYGIGFNEGAMLAGSQRGQYDDSADTYWALVNTLIRSAPRLMADQCHIMFWFAMEHYTVTKATFEAAGFTVDPYPLYWHKSDGKGIIPDPKRGPRRIVETALILRRGDRFIVKAVGNCISAPTQKHETEHISLKPEPVLMHFFQLFVDESSFVLDPTCGSGSSIAAALRCGAKVAIGIEKDESYVELANSTVRRARAIVSTQVKEG